MGVVNFIKGWFLCVWDLLKDGLIRMLYDRLDAVVAEGIKILMTLRDIVVKIFLFILN